MKYLVVIWGGMVVSMSFIPCEKGTLKEIIKDNNIAYDKAIDAELCLTGSVLKDFTEGVENIAKLKNGDIVTLEPELINLMKIMI